MRTLACFALALVAAIPAAAQRSTHGAGMVEKNTRKGTPYAIFVPEGRQRHVPYPLVMLVQDKGASPAERVEALRKLSSSAHPVYVMATAFEWPGEDDAEAVMDVLEQTMHEVAANHTIDMKRVVCVGEGAGGKLACHWAIRMWSNDRARFPFAAVWCDGSAAGHARLTPEIPYRITVGATGDPSQKEAREGFRMLQAVGTDVSYTELAEEGPARQARRLKMLRAFVESLPAHHGCLGKEHAQPEEARHAIEAAVGGEFKVSLDKLAELTGKSSAIKSEGKVAMASLVRSIRAYLQRLAKDEPRRLVASPDMRRHDAFVAIAKSLLKDPKVGRQMGAAATALARHRVIRTELAARSAYEAARKTFNTTDPDAGKAAMRALATGKASRTEFGRRAAGFLRAYGEKLE